MAKGAIVKMKKTKKPSMKQIIESKRVLYGISREELAAAMLISGQTYLNRLANPGSFRLCELMTLAAKLRCTVAELVGETI